MVLSGFCQGRPAKKGQLAFTCIPKYLMKPGIGMDEARNRFTSRSQVVNVMGRTQRTTGLRVQWPHRLRMPVAQPLRLPAPCPGLGLTTFPTSFLVSPSCFVSEYSTAGLCSRCWVFLWLFCSSLPFVLHSSTLLQVFYDIFYDSFLLESPLYCHSICFHHLLSNSLNVALASSASLG